MRRTVQPGCSLCGELVQSPHWCIKRYEQAHEQFVKGNERYKAAMALQRAEQYTEQPEPRQGVIDLAEWGDWTWCREQGFESPVVDKAAAQRAERVIASLTVDQRRELRAIYVTRCESVRQALRSKSKVPGEVVARLKQKLPVFTSAEMSYLDAVRGKRAA
jgi:hypothetical protein